MINIAICFETEADNAFFSSEIRSCFLNRHISVSIHSFSHDEIRSQAYFHPDIFLYSCKVNDGNIIKTVQKLKADNPEMISLAASDASDLSLHEQLSLKPILFFQQTDRKDLWEKAYRAYELCINNDLIFTYYHRPRYVLTPYSDILYFASEARRIRIFSIDRTQHTFYQKLDDLDLSLQNKSCKFIRIHKSYLVNASYISDFNRNYVFLANGETLKISSYQRYLSILKDLHACRLTACKSIYADCSVS